MRTAKAPPPEPEEGQPAENFKMLAKKLMAVPKKELDAKIAEHEREKGREKERKKKAV